METQENSEEKKETKTPIIGTSIPRAGYLVLLAIGCIVFFLTGLFKLIHSFITKDRKKERKRSLWFMGISFVTFSLTGYFTFGKWPKYSNIFKN